MAVMKGLENHEERAGHEAAPRTATAVGKFNYRLESGGYTVFDGKRFIGRVARRRSSYEHSNGRTYRSWSWSAFTPDWRDATFHHRTRAKAASYLRAAVEVRP